LPAGNRVNRLLTTSRPNHGEEVNEAAVTVATQPRNAIRFRGRSFLALVLVPEAPLAAWMVELDDWNKRSPGFFRGRPVVLDVSGIELDKDGLAQLINDLAERDVRLIGVEGTKASWLTLGMPPLISGGRQASDVTDVAEIPPREEEKASIPVLRVPPPQATESLVVDSPVRSGQSIIFPQGDVTIIGSVASGSEVIAGGSIHVYGALRGRAIAGSIGNPRARIFCNKLEAELVAIDGLYRTADEMDPQFRGKRVQAWLTGDSMTMAALA
jgi:septum site-determining protein MinC